MIKLKLAILTVVMMTSSVSNAGNGFTDGFCEKANKANDTIAWILDASPEALAAFNLAGLSTQEALSLHGAAFQSVQKDSRARLRHRVYWTSGRTCDHENYLDAPCISWRTNNDPLCGGYDFITNGQECTVAHSEDTRGSCLPIEVCSANALLGQTGDRYCTNACQSTKLGSTQGCGGRPGTICTMEEVKECWIDPFSCDEGLACLAGKCVKPCSRNGECDGDDVCYNNSCHGVCRESGGTVGGLGSTGWNGRPKFLMCPENLGGTGADARLAFDVIRHEYMHTLGLGHSDDACSTTDGCESELMCHVAASNQFMSSGDGAGLRHNYGTGTGLLQAYDLRSAYGASVAPDNSISSFPFGGSSTFTPRIDCTPGNTSTECVSVRGFMHGTRPHIAVTKLSGLGSAGNWATQRNWAYIPWNFTGEADVAISQDGQYAYVAAKTRTAERDQVAIVRVDLNSYGKIRYYKTGDSNTKRALQRNSFNPRIETMPLTGQPFVAVRSRDNTVVGDGIKFVFLDEQTAIAQLTAVNTPALDAILSRNDSTMWGDFDIDCAKQTLISGYGECTLVGTAHKGSTDTAINKQGSFFATTIYQTRKWVYKNGFISTQYPIDGNTSISWSIRSGIAGIGGVTMIPNTSGYELLVSANRIIRGGGSNSYLFRFDNNDDITNTSLERSYDIDAGGCSSAWTTVGTIYNRTQHGGADLAWSEDSNTTASFKMYGNSDGFCF